MGRECKKVLFIKTAMEVFREIKCCVAIYIDSILM